MIAAVMAAIFILCVLFYFFVPIGTKSDYIVETDAITCIGFPSPLPQDYHIIKGDYPDYAAIVTELPPGVDSSSCEHDPVEAQLYL